MMMKSKKGDVSEVTIAFWIIIILFLIGLAIVFSNFDLFDSLVSS